MDDLLTNIGEFTRRNELSDSQFGILALGDKNLLPQMKGEGGKRKRRLWPETEARVRQFMSEYRAPAEPS